MNIYENSKRISFRDLMSLTEKNKEYVDFQVIGFLKSQEEILRQNSFNRIPQRSYLFTDMINAQNLLLLYTYLEETKYAPHIVNCKTLLHNYLYSGYKIEKCFINPANSNLNLITQLHIDFPFQWEYKQYYYEAEKNASRYPTSIRKHFDTYIESKFLNNDALVYQILNSCPNKNTEKHNYQPRHYMPIYKIPEFLFSFLYYDGRIYPSTYEKFSYNRIPKLICKNQNSEFSYKLSLNKIIDFLESGSLKESEFIYHRYQLDKLFLLYNWEILKKYYDTYISDIFLDAIINSFQLSYKEIIHLKDFLIQEIWCDSMFLETGHNSCFMDYMLPFDIYFQYYLFSGNNSLRINNIKGLEGLKTLIILCKNFTRTIWNMPLYSIPVSILSMNDNFINIVKTQENIKEVLQNNPFYQEYYSEDNKNLDSSSVSPITKPFSFEILKLLLPK